MILSPGRQPVTRSERAAIKESATERFFYQHDLDNFYKQAIPIVNFYNSRDHYASSCLISSHLHNQWKINILKGICSQALEVIEELDSSLVTVPQKNSLLAVQTDLSHLLRVFPDTNPARQAATLVSLESARQPKGPLIHEPIPGSSRIPDPSPGSSGKKKKKVFICEICGVEKSKQQDLIDHKRNIHGEGHGSKEQQKLDKTHKCPNCGKRFFTQALLKKHLNADTCQISEKNFECEECKPSRWFMTNQSLVKHIKVYNNHEIEKFKCGYKGCKQLIGSKSALKQHKK